MIALVVALLALQGEGTEAPQQPVVPEAPAQESSAQSADESAQDEQASAADPVAAEEPVATESEAPVAPRTFEELEEALRALADANPERTRLESIGRSAGGRPIYVLTVQGPMEEGRSDDDPSPGLLVYEGGGSLAESGSLALTLARRLCDPVDARPAALLERATFYLAPAVDPDRCEPAVRPATGTHGSGPAAMAGGIEFERNFPLGWRPDTLCHGSGDFPLSLPSTLALARFFAARSNLAVIWGSCPPAGDGGFQHAFALPDLDDAVLQALAEEAANGGDHVGWRPLTSAGGGSLDYAYQAHGIFALGSCPPNADGESREATRRVDRALLLATRLPRLALETTGVARVGVNLWQLDLNLANVGALPTMSALGLERRGDGGLEVALTGARLVACAARRMDSPDYELCSHPEGAAGIAIQRLEGGERRAIRIVVEAESGTEVRLDVRGPWVADERETISIP